MPKSHPPILPPEEPEAESVASTLAALGRALQEAAAEEQSKSAVVDKVVGLVGKLDDDQRLALVRHPAFRALIEELAEATPEIPLDAPPGTITNRGQINQVKKPYTESWLRKEVEAGRIALASVISPSNETLIWNGLRRFIPADTEVIVESMFADLLVHKRRETKDAQLRIRYMTRQIENLPDHLADEATVRVRAYGDKGWYLPGGGTVAGHPAEEEKKP